jgi:hypothetical protein
MKLFLYYKEVIVNPKENVDKIASRVWSVNESAPWSKDFHKTQPEFKGPIEVEVSV